MTQVKHTPGPWVIFGDGDTRKLFIMPAGRPGDIATIQFGTKPDEAKDAETDANALLIAAAPDLLDALKAAIPALEHKHSFTSGGPKKSDALKRLRDARNAIAKAGGHSDA